MSECIVKAGESIEPSDPRLSDTACIVESGVIIRPPPDLTVTVPQPKSVVKLAPSRQLPIAIVSSTQKTDEQAAPVSQQLVKVESTSAHTEAPAHAEPAPPVDDSNGLNTTAAILAAGAAVAVAGSAAAGGVAGGFSTLQAKIASLFGSKTAVASAVAVTAGTIVAVKALEKKMSSLEGDLAKTKKEVGDAASSIDRIDALLDRLGN